MRKEFKKNKCHIILNTDAGTLSRIQPSVTMSRDMLSYEPGEMARYRFGKSWLRLFLLKFVQNQSMRASNGVIFLTNYASNIIQRSCGHLKNVRIINHGISENFRCKPSIENRRKYQEIIYVSNVDLYKHQWHVVRACSILEMKDLRLN